MFFFGSMFFIFKIDTDLNKNEINKNKLIKNKQMNDRQEEGLNSMSKILVDEVIDKDIRTEKKKLNNALVHNQEEESSKETFKLVEYNVERLEVLSGAFKQAKLYITVQDESITSSNLKFVCEDVIKKYNDFSSFIVCVYDNSEVGKNLANGLISLGSKSSQDKAWLAMYTFNPVEGAFFDDNPLKFREMF